MRAFSFADGPGPGVRASLPSRLPGVVSPDGHGGRAGRPTVRRRAGVRSTVEPVPGGLAPDTSGIIE